MNVYYVIEYFRPIHKFSETLIRPPAWYTHETIAGREVYIVDGRFSQTQSHMFMDAYRIVLVYNNIYAIITQGGA